MITIPRIKTTISVLEYCKVDKYERVDKDFTHVISLSDLCVIINELRNTIVKETPRTLWYYIQENFAKYEGSVYFKSSNADRIYQMNVIAEDECSDLTDEQLVENVLVGSDAISKLLSSDKCKLAHLMESAILDKDENYELYPIAK